MADQQHDHHADRHQRGGDERRQAHDKTAMAASDADAQSLGCFEGRRLANSVTAIGPGQSAAPGWGGFASTLFGRAPMIGAP